MSLLSSLLRTKPIAPHQEGPLKRVLSAWDLTLLGVGAIIGTGIFVLTGIAAATQAGPAVVLSFVISGIVCAFAALAYAELAASVGGCGSAYGYAYTAFGEIVAWMIGWILVLEYGVAVAAVANGWSGYFNNALTAIGLGLPDMLTKGPAKEGLVNLPAMSIILILMGLLIVGVRESTRLNATMVFVKVLTIAIFIAVGMFHINPSHWSPFMPFGWFDTLPDGHTIGILAGAAVVFFAYVGFDAVSTAVEEARDPQRNVPRGILASLAFCTVIYVIVSGILTGMVPYPELNVASPVAHALQVVGVSWASGLVAAGVIAGLTTVMLVLFYALTRVLLAMARDGLLPPFFAQVHPLRQTPVHNTVVCGVMMAIAAGFVPLGALAELVNIGTLTAFAVVCGGVVVLRLKHPELPRPFQAPFGLALPVLGVVSCLALIAFLPQVTHTRFAMWIGAGVLIYALYSYRHSKIR